MRALKQNAKWFMSTWLIKKETWWKSSAELSWRLACTQNSYILSLEQDCWRNVLQSCCCLVTKSRPTLCNPMDCSLLGFSVYEISQARILEWVAISFSQGSSRPKDSTHISCIAGIFLTTEPPGKPKLLCWLDLNTCLSKEQLTWLLPPRLMDT